MAQVRGKLSARGVATLNKRGRYGDGGGLWLQVSKWGTKAWVFRYTRFGKAHALGLGPVPDVTLAMARDKARECRLALLDGRDPLDDRRQQRRAARAAAAASTMTFREACSAYVTAQAPMWRNAKHTEQWRATLETYAGPVFGDLPVDAVTTDLVMRALEPIWTSKTETASRLRGRIEHVLDWAKVRGLRDGENPARWRGHLAKLLPSPRKVARGTHHPALPYADVPTFMQELRAQEGIAARALEFTILTAARTGEVIGAEWGEVDGELWTVPAARMKAHREHLVPLSPAALRALAAVRGIDERWVFPGLRKNRPLSNMAMLGTLRRMDRQELTVHGFRSTFRDWCAETTGYPAEVAEMALAHTITNKVEAAYRRGALLEKRRRLMVDWAGFCEGAARPGKITPMRRRGA